MNYPKLLFAFLIVVVCAVSPVDARNDRQTGRNQSLVNGTAFKPNTNSDFFLKNVRHIQRRNQELLLQAKLTAASTKKPVGKRTSSTALLIPISDLAESEASYILSSQFISPGHPAHGVINNVYGAPTWVVPRENALAILALLMSYKITHDPNLLDKANLAADYLVRVQDDADGGWYDQYSYADPYLLSKSPTQTAEVMMAFYKLGFDENRYDAMKKGAEFLLACQDPANKLGADDGLLGGGKKDDGTFQTYRWASDNSFAYWAFRAAYYWAKKEGDYTFAHTCLRAAARVRRGINEYLYIDDYTDPDYGVWRRVIDQNDVVVDPGYHEWINYAPQMLDLPVRGVGRRRVGEWIKNNLQKPDGAVVWDNDFFSERKSPGLSFQASLAWSDLRQYEYSSAALDWAEDSGLWQTTPDSNAITGGWIDWVENGVQAPSWQRFIDTSFYALAAYSGGYDFRIRHHDLYLQY